MRKKMYWGIASLILMIGVMGVYFMLQPDTDPEPKKKFIVPSEADLEKAREAKKPPREAKDGFTWEWHADHWHEVPISISTDVSKADTLVNREMPKSIHKKRLGTSIPNFGLVELENPKLKHPIPLRTTNVEGIDIDWKSLSPVELTDTIAKLERKAIFAPDGYHYRRRLDGMKLVLDENGYPIIHKDGEPHISVIWTMRFRPPQEIFEEYQQLLSRRYRLTVDMPESAELVNIRAKLTEIKSTYVGPLPLTYNSSYAVPEGELELYERRQDQMIAHVKNELFKQLGFEYLLEYY